MPYYKVYAKCGHVGRAYYYEGVFLEKAFSARDAAAVVRGRPRVKHHDKDAILSVEKITYNEYLLQRRQPLEVYFLCESIQDQRLNWIDIENRVYPEFNKINYGSLLRVDKSGASLKKRKYDILEKEDRLIMNNLKNVV